jgi:hypothetical protein
MFTRCYASRKISRAKGARPFETPAATAARKPVGPSGADIQKVIAGTRTMAEFNVRVAFRGELIPVLRIPVAAVEGHARLTAAMDDELAIADFDQDPEEGEVWIDLFSDAGEWLLHECARFHRADAADALRLYAEHCAIVQEWTNRNKTDAPSED